MSAWPLDETTGPDYADAFDSNDGTGNASPLAVGGAIDGAQQFDGATTGIDVAADNSFNWLTGDSFSFEFWIRRNGAVVGNNQVAIGRSAGANPNTSLIWWMGIGGDADATVTQNVIDFILGDADGGGFVTVKGTTDVTDDQWHHVVAVRDRSAGAAGQNLLYVDGNLDIAAGVDAAYNAGFDSATAKVTFGYLDLGALFRLQGSLDAVAFYDRALTPAEILAHSNAGQAGNSVVTLSTRAQCKCRPRSAAVKETTVVTLDGTGSTRDADGTIKHLRLGTKSGHRGNDHQCQHGHGHLHRTGYCRGR